jgi:hypothetical protein
VQEFTFLLLRLLSFTRLPASAIISILLSFHLCSPPQILDSLISSNSHARAKCKSIMDRHERIATHSHEKPFKCPFCRKGYPQNSNRNTHARKCKEIKKYIHGQDAPHIRCIACPYNTDLCAESAPCLLTLEDVLKHGRERHGVHD